MKVSQRPGVVNHLDAAQSQVGLEYDGELAAVRVEFVDLDVPVAELAPEGMPQRVGGFVVAVLLEVAVGLVGGFVLGCREALLSVEAKAVLDVLAI